MRQFLFLLFLSTLCISNTHAQFKSLTIEAPDTVYAEETFEIKAHLTSNGWSSARWEDIGYPFKFVKQQPSSRQSEGIFTTLHVAIEVKAMRDGVFELPHYLAMAADTMRTTPGKRICVLANKEYGQEQTEAYRWLKERCHLDSVTLNKEYHDSFLSVFNDNRKGCFAVVANHRYWQKLGCPILAFSADNSYNLEQANSLKNEQLLTQYCTQLMALDSLPVAKSQHTCGNIEPLLGKTAWGQMAPYNLNNPTFNGKAAPVGCQVTALAQAMRYYNYPSKFKGRSCYMGPDKKIYEVNLEQWKPSWALYADTYSEKNGNANDATIAPLCTVLGYAINAQHGAEATSGNLAESYRALCHSFGYSTRLSLLRNASETCMLDALYRELSCQRPCIVSWIGHAFICDGVYEDFLHYNLGWNGQDNGYYRPIICQPSDKDNHNMLIKQMLIGLEPQAEEWEYAVVTEAPGQLSTVLDAVQQATVSRLKITGPLNSADIRLIRSMAGAIADATPWLERTGGNLTAIDLSEARLTYDENPYLTTRAESTWTHSWTDPENGVTTSQTFDFKQMDKKEWEYFCETVGKQKKGVTYERVADNNYLAHYHTEEDEITGLMFDNCKSLKEIVLPNNIQSIASYAFKDCVLLEKIDIPESVSEVRQCFVRCSSLESIVMHRNYGKSINWCKDCSRLLKYEMQSAK